MSTKKVIIKEEGLLKNEKASQELYRNKKFKKLTREFLQIKFLPKTSNVESLGFNPKALFALRIK
jgi:hypothetical protein